MSVCKRHPELDKLLELYCENQLTVPQSQRLEEILRDDAEALGYYLDYVELHGTLLWDAGAQARVSDSNDSLAAIPVVTPAIAAANDERTMRPRLFIGAGIAAVAVCALAIAFAYGMFAPAPETPGPIAGKEPANEDEVPLPRPRIRPIEPIQIEGIADHSEDSGEPEEVIVNDPPNAFPGAKLNDGEIIAQINEMLRSSWADSEVAPSEKARKSVWIRRAYLDVVGRVPSVDDLTKASEEHYRDDWRQEVIDQLLASDHFPRTWSTRWANLLIGRDDKPTIDRPSFEKFLRDRFAHNDPWNETVAELISAEGAGTENGATNFLLAHLNSQALPATAVTARCFLGMQIQCTQCHDHPFHKSWKQDQFWSLNSFFKQTRSERGDQRGAPFVLTSNKTIQPTRYETLRGLLVTTHPEFQGHRIDETDATLNRRAELAEIVTRKDTEQLARSMVNRTWAAFFGFGFTRPIDDMGPHNPPTNPELLNLLASQFAANGFDVKQLVRWICLSDAYTLSSRFGKTNSIDAPDIGEIPLFSRMYVRPMSPEQVYDSLIVATQADQVAGFDWSQSSELRQEWIQQFIFAHDTEENDEASTFDGSITQALSLMHSDLVQRGLSGERGTVLNRVINEKGSFTQKVRKLCMAALSREPTEREMAAFRRIQRRTKTPQKSLLQDTLWAYLNANEFVLIH